MVEELLLARFVEGVANDGEVAGNLVQCNNGLSRVLNAEAPYCGRGRNGRTQEQEIWIATDEEDNWMFRLHSHPRCLPGEAGRLVGPACHSSRDPVPELPSNLRQLCAIIEHDRRVARTSADHYLVVAHYGIEVSLPEIISREVRRNAGPSPVLAQGQETFRRLLKGPRSRSLAG